MEFNLLGLPLLVPALIAIWLAAYAWRMRKMLGALPIFFLTFLLALWSIGYALELVIPSLPTKLFFAKLQYISIVHLPLLLLVFSVQYTGHEKWITRQNLVLLLLVPWITLLLVWTNELHHLIWKTVTLVSTGTGAILKFEYGQAFWTYAAYSYVELFFGTLLLAYAFSRSHGVYKKQSFVLVLGALAPWLGNALYIFGWNPFGSLDLTPFAFTITGLFYSWGQFRFQLLDLVPVARDALIENMLDAVIVLDMRHRIVDINPAGQRLLGGNSPQVIGRPVSDAFQNQAKLVSIYQDTLQTHTEIFLGQDEARRLYDLRISPIYDRHGALTARFIVLRDISERWHAERAIQKARDELELRVEERTAGIRAVNDRLQEEIRERIAMADALAYRLALDELIAGISTRFINLEPRETNYEIVRALQLIGEFTKVDRSYVFLLSEDATRMDNTHYWRAPEVVTETADLRNISVDRFPWWMEKLRRLEPINISSLQDLPVEASAEKDFFTAQNIQSLIIVPMVRRGKLVGFHGFDTVRASEKKLWMNEDITLLKMVGEIFVNALERKRAVEQIEASIQEKDLLLKEIHHRVKNNLQIISSLLSLQAGTIRDPEILEIFRESQNRVRTMGLIHEKLYQSNNLANIDFRIYIQNLTAYLFNAFDGGRKGINLRLDINTIHLAMDTAVPCGLIINELVSNAFKYAYPQGTGGEIRIELKEYEGEKLRLKIADDGVGFPENGDFREMSSLGLRLVCSLVDQLDGTIELEREGGTAFVITFAAN